MGKEKTVVEEVESVCGLMRRINDEISHARKRRGRPHLSNGLINFPFSKIKFVVVKNKNYILIII